MTHSDGTYEEKSRRWTWLTKRDKVKFPWYTHRLMHRKRVTCELHDSYFRFMTIKQGIPNIELAIELLYNSVKTGSQRVGDQRRRRQDVVGKATPGRRGPGVPRWSWGSDSWREDGSWGSETSETRCVRKVTPGRRGPRDPRWSFGDQLVIRSSKESHQPSKSWALESLVETPWRTRKTQRWRL